MSIIGVFLLATFVQDHPDVVIWFMGGLLSIIITLITGLWATLNKRLQELECEFETIDTRVGHIEVTLESYKTRVGLGDVMIQELRDGIKNLSTQLSGVHTDNLQAHSLITERLAKVETRLPNGEIQEALSIIKKIYERT